MDVFNQFKNKEGTGIPAPSSGYKRYFYILYTHFFKLVGLNFLTILFAVPLVTAPAALSAADRVYILLLKNGNCFLWQDFIKEFREELIRLILPGMMFALILFSGYFFMSLGKGNSVYLGWSSLFWMVGILLTVLGLSWGRYTLVLAAMQSLSIRKLMKNDVLLCAINPARAVLTAAVIVAAIFAAAVLMPVSLAVIAVIWVAFIQFTTCFIVYEFAEKNVITEEQ